MPDLDRILQLARLFGVSTDHLLLEEGQPQGDSSRQDAVPVRRVTLEQAKAYLEGRKEAIGTAYWLGVTAVGFALVMHLCDVFLSEDGK